MIKSARRELEAFTPTAGEHAGKAVLIVGGVMVVVLTLEEAEDLANLINHLVEAVRREG